MIYLCLPPTREGQASEQYCSCCLTHFSPPFGPTLLSAHPQHLMLVYRLSLLHTPRGSVACFTLHYFHYYLLISCVCDSLRRVDALQNNTSFFFFNHMSILAPGAVATHAIPQTSSAFIAKSQTFVLEKIESSRAHLHLKYGPVLQDFSLE